MGGERPGIVHSEGNRYTRLEGCKYPYLYPTTLLIEEPREQYARLQDGKDVLACRHRLVNVRPCLVYMELRKAITTRSIRQSDNVMRSPPGGRRTLTIQSLDKNKNKVHRAYDGM